MISHLRSYCEIGNPGHELMNDKLIRGFCHDVEYTMIDFKKLEDKIISNRINKSFHYSINVFPYKLQ